jgi:hypothetical protein
MASLKDIAAMKLNAIVQDGSRMKDYIDIYMLLEQQSLSTLLSCYEQKYPNVSWHFAKKALLYIINFMAKITLLVKQTHCNNGHTQIAC